MTPQLLQQTKMGLCPPFNKAFTKRLKTNTQTSRYFGRKGGPPKVNMELCTKSQALRKTRESAQALQRVRLRFAGLKRAGKGVAVMGALGGVLGGLLGTKNKKK